MRRWMEGLKRSLMSPRARVKVWTAEGLAVGFVVVVITEVNNTDTLFRGRRV